MCRLYHLSTVRRCADEVGAIGLYSDLHAAKIFVKERKTYTPNPEKAEIYKKYYNAYRGIYNAVRQIIEEIDV